MRVRWFIFYAVLMVLGYYAGINLSHGNWKLALPLTLAAVVWFLLRRSILRDGGDKAKRE